MFPNPLVLNDGVANKSYDYRGSTIDASSYKDSTATVDQPSLFTVKHRTLRPAKADQTRQSLFQLSDVVEDAEGMQGTIVCNLTLSIPEKVATKAQIEKIVAKMTDLLLNNSAKIVAGEI